MTTCSLLEIVPDTETHIVTHRWACGRASKSRIPLSLRDKDEQEKLSYLSQVMKFAHEQHDLLHAREAEDNG